jgi:hypothetical protein
LIYLEEFQQSSDDIGIQFGDDMGMEEAPAMFEYESTSVQQPHRNTVRSYLTGNSLMCVIERSQGKQTSNTPELYGKRSSKQRNQPSELK